MLKIWGRASSSNVQKVLWCCAELEIPFERVDVGGPFGGNRDPEYLGLNPERPGADGQGRRPDHVGIEHDLPLSRNDV